MLWWRGGGIQRSSRGEGVICAGGVAEADDDCFEGVDEGGEGSSWLGENSADEIPVGNGVGRKAGDREAVVALKSGRVREREGWRWRAHGVG